MEGSFAANKDQGQSGTLLCASHYSEEANCTHLDVPHMLKQGEYQDQPQIASVKIKIV